MVGIRVPFKRFDAAGHDIGKFSAFLFKRLDFGAGKRHFICEFLVGAGKLDKVKQPFFR